MKGIFLLYSSVFLLLRYKLSDGSSFPGLTCSSHDGVYQVNDITNDTQVRVVGRGRKLLKHKLAESPLSEKACYSNHGSLLIEHVSELRGGFSFQSVDLAKISSFLPLKDLWFTKAVLQILLTLLNIFCWIMPLRSKNFTQNVELLSLANCFAGGIFMMLSFGHLIPEAISLMHSVDKSPADALRFALLGFLMMFFIEKIAFSHGTENTTEQKNDQTSKLDDLEGKTAVKKSFGLNSAMILCLAMSFHSFFEAAALGLATDFSSAIMMAASIGLHQPAESVALLVAFLKTDPSEKGIYTCLLAFSCVALLGVAAGIIISVGASTQIEAAVVAITAGTFIYVGAAEVSYTCCLFFLPFILLYKSNNFQ